MLAGNKARVAAFLGGGGGGDSAGAGAGGVEIGAFAVRFRLLF